MKGLGELECWRFASHACNFVRSCCSGCLLKKKKERNEIFFFFLSTAPATFVAQLEIFIRPVALLFFFCLFFLVFFRSAATRLNIWSPSVCEAFQQQSPCSRHDCWGQARLKPWRCSAKKKKKYWNKSKACSLWVFFLSLLFCACWGVPSQTESLMKMTCEEFLPPDWKGN